MINREKPTLVLSDHPPLQRLAPVILNFLSDERPGVIVADHSMLLIANLFGVEMIPILRDLSKVETQTKGESYKQKILSVLGALSNSKPEYQHQGREVTELTLTALEDKNVFMSPSGASNRVAKWKPGISHIISEASKQFQDFSLSFVYIPESFKQKFSFVLLNSWTNLLDNQDVDWGDDHRKNAIELQKYYESLRA